jgi:dTDP-4-amino-4,6-dideoxygalactose transaminase
VIKVSRGCLGAEELAAVKEAFDYGYFGLAHKVDEFEDGLKRFLGAPFVVACMTGTAALHLALDVAGVGAGDEVLVPSLTFLACFQAIAATGAHPVACDVLPDTLLLDMADAERRVTPRTRAIMPVHYGGAPCDMDAVFALAKRHGLRVVEDAAHALGSSYQGRRIGSFGDLTCFSFDSIKNITCGEGGAVVCRDQATSDLLRQKRLLGMHRQKQTATAWKERGSAFEVATRGFRYHMSNINGAIGVEQLKKIGAFVARRQEMCRRYDAAFRSLSGLTLLGADYDQVAPHIYVVRVGGGRRDALMGFLKDRDIETGLNYVPNHLHALFRHDGPPLPQTDAAYREILTLPLHCGLSDADVDTVIGAVGSYFESSGGVA